jgi:hypothetical protein
MSHSAKGASTGLPFTGFASLPLVVVGLAITAAGALMTLIRPKRARG